MADQLRRLVRHSHRLTRWRLLRRLARDRRAPVVVFSMGKVASTAVFRGVDAAVDRPVLKVHSLRPERVSAMAEGYHRTAPRALPRHLVHAWHLVGRPATPAAPWTVITMVRDPIQRSVSDFFQSGGRMGRLDDSATTVRRLRRFVEREGIPRTLEWFDQELRPVLGIDVLEHPFDPEQGHAEIQAPSVRLLVLRQESLDAAPLALGQFLGLTHAVELPVDNAGAAKAYAAEYTAILEQVRFEDHVLDLAYGSAWAAHFYAPAELAAFRARWGRSAGETVA